VTALRFRLITCAIVSTLSINSVYSLPIDWTGVFGVDTHLLSNTCRTSDTVDKDFAARNGTQGISGECDAAFQTYVARLHPSIIVNDGVNLKGEFSTGHIRGGFAGDNSANNQDGSGNNSYFFTTPAQRSTLNINQLYMELYADTALVKIGRMSRHYGLGLVFNGGHQPWDRFFTMYDGIEAEMRIGNFSLIPHWAKIASYGENQTEHTKAQPAGIADVRELGMIAKYDNRNRDLIVSLLYAKRSSERRNTLYTSQGDDTTQEVFGQGRTQVTIIEPYISKKWDRFHVAFEASLQSGEYGNVYDPDETSRLDTRAYVLEARYEFNPKWEVGFTGGQVSGDDGATSRFEATYLHPNYQVADLMFRYHYPSFTEGGRSIFDSSITNTRFFKFHGHYKTDKWTWKSALIFAKAQETASANAQAWHHEENYRFTSQHNQADDLGWELDFGFDYRWNPNVTITGYYGYWKVGDYYGFTNESRELSLSNVHGGGLRATLEF
jgi:hypothetical protein